MDIPDVIQVMEQVADGCLGIPQDTERRKLLAACEKMRAFLETPYESTLQIAYGAHRAIALRVAVDMGIFDAAVVCSNDEGQLRVPTFLRTLGGDVPLIRRLMRLLAGMRVFKEVGPRQYALTPLAREYVSDAPLTDIVIHVTSHMEVLSKLPQYFKNNDYSNPAHPMEGPFRHVTRLWPYYGRWLSNTKRTREKRAFNSVFKFMRMLQGEHWFEFYPFEKDLQVNSDPPPVLVDIGGGLIPDMDVLKERFPNSRLRLVLWELPIMYNVTKDKPSLFSVLQYHQAAGQPVKGATAYFLRTVLAYWPDQIARNILGQIRDMMSETSVLLVYETIMPEEDEPLSASQLDFSMMAMFSSSLRTWLQFRALFESAGFRMTDLYEPKVMIPGTSGMLFECRLK